jgi:hypothetical protein
MQVHSFIHFNLLFKLYVSNILSFFLHLI